MKSPHTVAVSLVCILIALHFACYAAGLNWTGGTAATAIGGILGCLAGISFNYTFRKEGSPRDRKIARFIARIPALCTGAGILGFFILVVLWYISLDRSLFGPFIAPAALAVVAYFGCMKMSGHKLRGKSGLFQESLNEMREELCSAMNTFMFTAMCVALIGMLYRAIAGLPRIGSPTGHILYIVFPYILLMGIGSDSKGLKNRRLVGYTAIAIGLMASLANVLPSLYGHAMPNQSLYIGLFAGTVSCLPILWRVKGTEAWESVAIGLTVGFGIGSYLYWSLSGIVPADARALYFTLFLPLVFELVYWPKLEPKPKAKQRRLADVV